MDFGIFFLNKCNYWSFLIIYKFISNVLFYCIWILTLRYDGISFTTSATAALPLLYCIYRIIHARNPVYPTQQRSPLSDPRCTKLIIRSNNNNDNTVYRARKLSEFSDPPIRLRVFVPFRVRPIVFWHILVLQYLSLIMIPTQDYQYECRVGFF